MKVVFSLFALLCLGGCASTERYKLAQNINTSNLATLHIYRTETIFQCLLPGKPFIYLGDKVIAKLGAGESETVQVPAGRYRLSVRQPFLFLPGSESDNLEQEFQAGLNYYLRYSLKFGGAIGSSVSVVESTDFHLVDAESFEARR